MVGMGEDMAKAPKTPNPFELIEPDKAAELAESEVHIYANGAVCATDALGHSTPKAMSRVQIRVDATEGFIPLWDRNVQLRWRFNEKSLLRFTNPAAAADALRQLFGEAVLAWDYACPVTFTEKQDAWDFEFAVSGSDDCSAYGCTLAKAFFPDSGRHTLYVYPKLFEQTPTEQVETLVHELGHVFGLRHFFANITETRWASEHFGENSEFTIMNYGEKSSLTSADKRDLKSLYDQVWDGRMTHINETPIRLVRPFSEQRFPPEMFTFAARP